MWANIVGSPRSATNIVKVAPNRDRPRPSVISQIAALYDRLKWAQYTRFGIEEDAMPEAQSDIDYTVDIGRHETTFRANTPKGEEFLGGVDLTMSNEEAHTFIQDARTAGLTVKSFF
jgi:hypothetical protein